MTALLPPNLLKLFAPRPPVPYLKPLTRDEKVRGPNKLVGIAPLKQRLKEEADDDEIKQGLADQPITRAEGEAGTVDVGKGGTSGEKKKVVPEKKEEEQPVVDVSGMKVVELKEELTKRGLSTKGLKKEVSYYAQIDQRKMS
jgi:U1 small nuclear ribonucleoprotein